MGVGRYLLASLPVFYAAGMFFAPRPSLATGVLFSSILLQGALTSFWLTGVWLA